MMDLHLRIKNLSVQLDDFALQDIDLDIQDGEYFVLLGPTGSGKTILLEAIAGIIPPSSGSIQLAGREIVHDLPETRGLGFVYQDFALFPHLNVERNISFGLDNKRKNLQKRSAYKKVMEEKVQEISSLLHITNLLDRTPDSLSGGEKQRVAIARALVMDPKVLLLDEPLSSLDPESRESVQSELKKIHQDLGTTTLHITHNFEVAAALADRIGIIMDGSIVQIGPPREVFRQPVNEKVAQFVGVRNIFRGQHYKGSDDCGYLQLDGFELASISDREGDVRASIRPEDILLSQENMISSARNNFWGIVTKISNRGSFSYITIRIPSPDQEGKDLDLVVLVTQSSVLDLDLEIGREVYAAFKASALHVF